MKSELGTMRGEIEKVEEQLAEEKRAREEKGRKKREEWRREKEIIEKRITNLEWINERQTRKKNIIIKGLKEEHATTERQIEKYIGQHLKKLR